MSFSHFALMASDDATPAPLALRALGQQEWALVEQLTPHLRAVGALMQQEGRRLAQGADAPPPPGFDVVLWAAVLRAVQADFAGLVVPPAPVFPKKPILARVLENQVTKTALRCRVLAALPTPPPQEPPELGLAALQCWVLGAAPLLTQLDRCLTLEARLSSGELPALVTATLRDQLAALGQSLSLGSEAPAVVAALPALGTPPRFPQPEGPRHLRLYSDQAAFARAILDGLAGAPVVVRYCTPPSGGKTTAAALLAACLHARMSDARGNSRGDTRACPRLLYACFANAVRIEVARLLLAANVPFVLWTNGVASPSFSCYTGRRPPRPPSDARTTSEHVVYGLSRLLPLCPRTPIAWVCDLASAAALVAERAGQDVLMLDEPTASGPRLTAAQAQVLTALPRPHVVALVSATLPPPAAMPCLLAGLGGRVVDIAVDRQRAVPFRGLVGGSVVAPHRLVTPTRLVGALRNEQAQWLRFYGPEACAALWQDYPELWPRDDAWTKCSAEVARTAVLRVLEAAVSAIPPAMPVFSPPTPLLNLAGLCVGGALPGTTFVVRVDGDEMLAAALLPLLDAPVGVLLKQTLRLHAEAATRQEAAGRLEERRSSQLTKADRAALGHSAEIPQSTEPADHWPLETVVNTREHARRYRTGHPGPYRLAPPRFPEDVVRTSAAPLVEAALAGVVAPASTLVDRQYELAALAAVDAGQVTYVAATLDLIYGVNLPVDRVVLPPELRAYADLKQACGRAGRVGKSTVAEIWFADWAQAIAAFDDGRGTSDPPPPLPLEAYFAALTQRGNL